MDRKGRNLCGVNINIGDKIRKHVGTPGEELCHIVAIVSDGDEELVVVKQWMRRRKYWQYSVEKRWLLERELGREYHKIERA